MKKIVLTGAAGRLGSYLREPLTKLADQLLSTDLAEGIDSLYKGEVYQRADLSNYDQVSAVLEDADQVIHFGAIGDEAPFDDILQSNIIGAYNIWEAAYQQGVQRVVYASSVHAVGMHKTADMIDTEVEHKPDTYYGLAKCFGEDLARMYWDKRGTEAVCLRIYSCAKVNNVRSLGTWLSYDDLIHLVECGVQVSDIGFHVVYGVSNNDRITLTNSGAERIGFQPKDNAEQFADEVLANAESTQLSPYIGGPFANIELGNSGLAGMNIVDDRKNT